MTKAKQAKQAKATANLLPATSEASLQLIHKQEQAERIQRKRDRCQKRDSKKETNETSNPAAESLW
jgi:hypothetical protein